MSTAQGEIHTGRELRSLVERLRDPALFDHPVEHFAILETHISCILLTGPYAYKFKKPVDLGFLDFSSLDRRRFYCEEEVRLNRRLAPELYREVIPITGSPEAPRIGGPGEAIEYAVMMVEFPQEAQFDRLLEAGRLNEAQLDDLAVQIADFHGRAPPASPTSGFGTPTSVAEVVLDNFSALGTEAEALLGRGALERARRAASGLLKELEPLFLGRRREGRVRECHGDLHLTNIAWLDGRAVAFDCIEFSEALRWTDVMSEVAFLLMDLESRDRGDLAARFLNGYLERTGDYGGLAVLRHYLAYRAMVRAKVAWLRHAQASGKEREETASRFARHFAQACGYLHGPRPLALIITHGASGSGKTRLSMGLAQRLGAVRVRSDVERKRMRGLAGDARTGSALGGDLYTPAATGETYRRLGELARKILEAGFPALVDATFLKAAQRAPFASLAEELDVPLVILDLDAPEAVLRERVSAREREGRDASEATLAVLVRQIAEREALDAAERSSSVRVDTGRSYDIEAVSARLRALLRPSPRCP